MKTIQVKEADIQSLYKSLLEHPSKESVEKEFCKIFDKKILAPDITDRVKTFEDAMEICSSVTATDEQRQMANDYIYMVEMSGKSDFSKDLIVYLQLRIICSALNEGWIPQFTEDEYRYYPWFYIYTKEEWDTLSKEERARGVLFGGTASYGANCGFVSADSYYAPSDAITNFGSRLCLKNHELATYCGTQFCDLWATLNTGMTAKKCSK